MTADLLPGEGATWGDVLDGQASWWLGMGDCREMLATMPAGAIETVITDPPYSSVTHQGARGGNGPRALVRDAFAHIEVADLRQILGMCAPRRWCVATVDWRHCGPLESEPPEGLRFVRFGVWVKPNGAPQFTGDRPATGWEAVAILHAVGGRMRWTGGGGPAVWRINKTADGDHPTGKPIPLVRRFVDLFSDAGELVADPFAGSGTTGACALQLGRRFIGCEIDQSYWKVARARLGAAYAARQLALMEVPV